jgi:hypothetical protein
MRSPTCGRHASDGQNFVLDHPRARLYKSVCPACSSRAAGKKGSRQCHWWRTKNSCGKRRRHSTGSMIARVGTVSMPNRCRRISMIPAVSIVQDILVYGNDDHLDCLLLSTIPFPFSAGTTQSHAITQCNQPPDLTSEITGYIIDQVVIGALISAANATGQQFDQTPTPIITIHDELF